MISTILNHRASLTLILGAVLVLATGIYAHHDITGVPEDVYWDSKIRWSGSADCVLAGDSRVYVGLSPTVMSSMLSGQRVCNFGFSACGYRPDYLESVEAVLDSDGSNRSIILGITPHSLTNQPTVDSEFRLRGRQPEASNRYVAELIWRLRPFALKSVVATWLPMCRPSHYYRHYFEDGWVAASIAPAEPELTLRYYRDTFGAHQVEPELIANVLDFTRKWAAQGIRVYAFRPPSGREMLELENSLSAFREDEFVAQFTAVGGVWLETDPLGYFSYDGSHLRWDAAAQFSRDLAWAIRAAETSGPARSIRVARGFTQNAAMLVVGNCSPNWAEADLLARRTGK